MTSAEQQLETTECALRAHESLHEGAASYRPVMRSATSVRVALLTGGDDRPYALGKVPAPPRKGGFVDFFGGDKRGTHEMRNTPQKHFPTSPRAQNKASPILR